MRSTPWPSSASCRRRPRPRSGRRAANAVFDIARIDAIEREMKHDVIAFLTHLAEIVGPEARFVHQGMTSSDVLDTCFTVQLTRAADLLLADLDALLAALKRRAFEHKDTPTIGRSHGIHAEPTTFGLKLAFAYAEFDRARRAAGIRRARRSPPAPSPARSARSPMSTRAWRRMSRAPWACGPSRSPRRSSRATATRCSSRRSPSSPRRSSAWPPRSATCSAPKCWRRRSISRRARRARRRCRTSATRCCRRTSPGWRGWCAPMRSPRMENVALWHERDISHSSVERMIGPDATVTLDFALARLTGVIDKLVVYPERDAREPRPAGRADPLAARAPGADPERAFRARRPMRWSSGTP